MAGISRPQEERSVPAADESEGRSDGEASPDRSPDGPPSDAAGASTEDSSAAAHVCLNTPSGRAGISAGVAVTDPGEASGLPSFAAPCASEPPGAAETGAPLFGNNACCKSFQVAIAATASTRGSVPASINDSAPPYDPPVTPTRGSSGPSWTTSGRPASQSTRARASGTS